MINYGKQTLKDNDFKAVIKTLRSNFLTSGNVCKKTELQINFFF